MQNRVEVHDTPESRGNAPPWASVQDVPFHTSTKPLPPTAPASVEPTTTQSEAETQAAPLVIGSSPGSRTPFA